MNPFTVGEKISHGPGPLKAWTEMRDFPAPNKERFRDWWKKNKQNGESIMQGTIQNRDAFLQNIANALVVKQWSQMY